MASSSAGKSQGSSGSSGSSTGRRRAGSRTAAAGATGATARARLGTVRSRSRAATRPKAQPDPPIAEPTITTGVGQPTVPATDETMAATNARRALNPDMPRVAWLRTQLQNMETHRRERLTKVAQLTLIAIVFITFVLQNADPVDVQFLFSFNIRLIWVIVGCALLGGVAGYLIGRPEKSLRELLPPKAKEKGRGGRAAR